MKLRTLYTSLLICPALLSASLVGPAYPPPGGVTVVASGTGSGDTGGKTFAYSNFNSSQYSTLYWGPISILNVDNVGDPPTANMSFVGLNGAAYEFDSTANWTFNGTFTGTQHLPTRLLLTVSGLGAEDSESNLGATTNPTFPLFQVTGNFSANFVFQAFANSTWTPVNDYQNQNNNSGPQNRKSASFSFFSTPATTPEPGTWMLFGTGLAGLVFVRRRTSAGTAAR